jgi:hypothetical protein
MFFLKTSIFQGIIQGFKFLIDISNIIVIVTNFGQKHFMMIVSKS